jgi:hypothetical protein
VSSVCPEPMVLEFCAKYIQVCHNCIWILISNCPRVWKIPDYFVSDLLVFTTQSEQTLVITNTKSSGISQSLGQYMYLKFFWILSETFRSLERGHRVQFVQLQRLPRIFSQCVSVYIFADTLATKDDDTRKKISSKSTCYHLSYHSAKSCDFGVSYQICRYIQSASRITDKNFNFSGLKIFNRCQNHFHFYICPSSLLLFPCFEIRNTSLKILNIGRD